MNPGPREDHIAGRLLVATWVLHVATIIVAGVVSWWLLFIIPAYVTIMAISGYVGSHVYDDFKNDETFYQKYKIVILVSAIITLAVPWIIWYMRCEYIENMIKDIIE